MDMRTIDEAIAGVTAAVIVSGSLLPGVEASSGVAYVATMVVTTAVMRVARPWTPAWVPLVLVCLVGAPIAMVVMQGRPTDAAGAVTLVGLGGVMLANMWLFRVGVHWAFGAEGDA